MDEGVPILAHLVYKVGEFARDANPVTHPIDQGLRAIRLPELQEPEEVSEGSLELREKAHQVGPFEPVEDGHDVPEPKVAAQDPWVVNGLPVQPVHAQAAGVVLPLHVLEPRHPFARGVTLHGSSTPPGRRGGWPSLAGGTRPPACSEPPDRPTRNARAT